MITVHEILSLVRTPMKCTRCAFVGLSGPWYIIEPPDVQAGLYMCIKCVIHGMTLNFVFDNTPKVPAALPTSANPLPSIPTRNFNTTPATFTAGVFTPPVHPSEYWKQMTTEEAQAKAAAELEASYVPVCKCEIQMLSGTGHDKDCAWFKRFGRKWGL